MRRVGFGAVIGALASEPTSTEQKCRRVPAGRSGALWPVCNKCDLCLDRLADLAIRSGQKLDTVDVSHLTDEQRHAWKQVVARAKVREPVIVRVPTHSIRRDHEELTTLGAEAADAVDRLDARALLEERKR
jgi:hypothetical protein